ncbi:MAG: hypothetical protein ABI548_14480 [Polyangiaceae bacterium]
MSDDCSTVCAQAYPDRNTGGLSCMLPSPCTYDDLGNCTATSADVLRQDGIMCGCANIGLI